MKGGDGDEVTDDTDDVAEADDPWPCRLEWVGLVLVLAALVSLLGSVLGLEVREFGDFAERLRGSGVGSSFPTLVALLGVVVVLLDDVTTGIDSPTRGIVARTALRAAAVIAVVSLVAATYLAGEALVGHRGKMSFGASAVEVAYPLALRVREFAEWVMTDLLGGAVVGLVVVAERVLPKARLWSAARRAEADR